MFFLTVLRISQSSSHNHAPFIFKGRGAHQVVSSFVFLSFVRFLFATLTIDVCILFSCRLFCCQPFCCHLFCCNSVACSVCVCSLVICSVVSSVVFSSIFICSVVVFLSSFVHLPVALLSFFSCCIIYAIPVVPPRRCNRPE